MEQRQLLQIQNSSKSEVKDHTNSNSSDEKTEIEYEPVNGTIFTLIKQEPKGKWEIVVGNKIASGKKFKTKRKARKYINKKPWELIFITAFKAAKAVNNENKENKS